MCLTTFCHKTFRNQLKVRGIYKLLLLEMPEGTGGLTVKQLLTVFRLCDPEETGRVKTEYLQNLARVYTEEDSTVS